MYNPVQVTIKLPSVHIQTEKHFYKNLPPQSAITLYQTTLVTECLITDITSIRALTSMYALMCYQMALRTECPITHFTGIRALTNM
jgi:hypothetical protein